MAGIRDRGVRDASTRFAIPMMNGPDLGALAGQHYPDPAGGCCNGRGLRAQCADRHAVAAEGHQRRHFGMDSYQSRDDEGTQSPLATLDRGWGSCRDIAVLLVEAARRLGLGHGWSPATWCRECARTGGGGDRRTPDRPTPGPNLPFRRGLGDVRSDQPHRRRLRALFRSRSRATSARRCRFRQLRGKQRRSRGHGGEGPRDLNRRAHAASGFRPIIERWSRRLAERIASRLDATARETFG